MSSARDSQPKLILVNLSHEWGGGERWFLNMTLELAKRGFNTRLLVMANSKLEQKAKQEQAHSHSMSLRSLDILNPVKMARLRSWLRQEQAHMVVLNGSHELKVVGLAAHQVGIAHIIFRRGVSYALSDKRLNHWYMKKVVTGFLANSQATYQAMAKTFPEIGAYPSLTLNNGIALPDPRPVLQSGSSGRIGLVARLSPEKGITRALEALEVLAKRSVHAELWLIGDGPEREKLEAQAYRSGLQDAIRFLGFREDVLDLLATCQVFLFTPHFGEGTSLALIEAMAVGLPCIAFDTPAMNEVIVDGKTGFLLPDGDIEGMSAKIELLLTREELRKHMGKQAQTRAYAEFSLQLAADKVAAFLKQLLEN